MPAEKKKVRWIILSQVSNFSGLKSTHIKAKHIPSPMFAQKVNANTRPAHAAKLVVARLGGEAVVPQLVPAADKLHVAPERVDQQVAVFIADGAVAGVDGRLRRDCGGRSSRGSERGMEAVQQDFEEGRAAVAATGVPCLFLLGFYFGVC